MNSCTGQTEGSGGMKRNQKSISCEKQATSNLGEPNKQEKKQDIIDVQEGEPIFFLSFFFGLGRWRYRQSECIETSTSGMQPQNKSITGIEVECFFGCLGRFGGTCRGKLVASVLTSAKISQDTPPHTSVIESPPTVESVRVQVLDNRSSFATSDFSFPTPENTRVPRVC